MSSKMLRSLYDLLNQHYMEYSGQRYVRIAHGSKAKQCPVHRHFRIIVVVEACTLLLLRAKCDRPSPHCNTDFCRKPQIFADSPLLLEIQVFQVGDRDRPDRGGQNVLNARGGGGLEDLDF